ncbi:transcriptional regulator, GntR family [Desulfofarcimen acetoxidans DSM 771]|jgi:DNA-binding transcriptional regulator YhcF (GntR family)|uniref:Transcriptional regulator, GntR family n=1 Tax=Desulfofarcimen acetoxidans (strain ATCC 49208 / DSM 771 / KCTC 5769 / VKM B-1644 / 5575) TaxID=485916 RepID=C8VWD4_DESAS|nr:GntR family transcriptional regulator [Desulfofarcimen acetoxidans]ACV62486.1 transcriptional regulator, GntR family [Desulfofarcimen acetoxidans DSM 771]
MSQSFNTTQPIYLQIIQRLCRQVIRGELGSGDKLPSVRDLAVQMGVNPNTAQRVYAEMERLQVAETRRGLGTFITENESRLKQLREELKKELISNFIADMQEMGYMDSEIVEGVRENLNKV